MDTIKSMIEAAVRSALAEQIKASIHDVLGATDAPVERKASSAPLRQQMRETVKAYRARAAAPRVDGRSRAKVAYIVIQPRASERARVERKATVAGLFPTARTTWDAIKATKTGTTAKAIEDATGLPKKTVESCVYFLRHAGLIESIKAE